MILVKRGRKLTIIQTAIIIFNGYEMILVKRGRKLSIIHYLLLFFRYEMILVKRGRKQWINNKPTVFNMDMK